MLLFRPHGKLIIEFEGPTNDDITTIQAAFVSASRRARRQLVLRPGSRTCTTSVNSACRADAAAKSCLRTRGAKFYSARGRRPRERPAGRHFVDLHARRRSTTDHRSLLRSGGLDGNLFAARSGRVPVGSFALRAASAPKRSTGSMGTSIRNRAMGSSRSSAIQRLPRTPPNARSGPA